MALSLFKRTAQPTLAAGSDVVLGYFMQGGTTTPIYAGTKTTGAFGAGIQSQLRARKSLGADDDGLALAYASNPIAHRCVDLRAQKVAEMPRRIVHRGTKDVIDAHPLLEAFALARRTWGKPLLYLWQSAKCIHGECYLEKVTDSFGRPATLRWLNPLAIEPYIPLDRIAYFEYQSDASAVLQLAPDTIVYDFYHNPLDDYRGLSPMQVALPSINILNGISEYQNSFFGNDARPGGILSARAGQHVNKTDQDRLLDFMNRQLKGARNAFRLIFMPASLEYQSVQQAPTPEHDTVERAAIRKVCDAFGVPVPLVDHDESRFQLSGEQPKAFYENTVIPDCMEIAEVINNDIMPFFDPGSDAVFEFDFDKIRALLDDQVKRATAINSRVITGVLSLNEARSEYGLAQWDGGDKLLMPLANRLVDVDDLPTLTDLTQGVAAPAPNAATPDPSGNSVPTGDTAAPRQENAQQELKAWARVARRRGASGALAFTTALVPPEIAQNVRGQLFALAADADAEQVKAIFDDARRQLLLLFDEAELAGLRERLNVLGMEKLLA